MKKIIKFKANQKLAKKFTKNNSVFIPVINFEKFTKGD